jgi:hypothetical protein
MAGIRRPRRVSGGARIVAAPAGRWIVHGRDLVDPRDGTVVRRFAFEREPEAIVASPDGARIALIEGPDGGAITSVFAADHPDYRMELEVRVGPLAIRAGDHMILVPNARVPSIDLYDAFGTRVAALPLPGQGSSAVRVALDPTTDRFAAWVYSGQLAIYRAHARIAEIERPPPADAPLGVHLDAAFCGTPPALFTWLARQRLDRGASGGMTREELGVEVRDPDTAELIDRIEPPFGPIAAEAVRCSGAGNIGILYDDGTFALFDAATHVLRAAVRAGTD